MTTIAHLAQLVEHRSYEPKVMGSSPILSIVPLENITMISHSDTITTFKKANTF